MKIDNANPDWSSRCDLASLLGIGEDRQTFSDNELTANNVVGNIEANLFTVLHRFRSLTPGTDHEKANLVFECRSQA